jgi:hypothetical protein
VVSKLTIMIYTIMTSLSSFKETVKYGHESAGLGKKNDWTGEAPQQFTRPTFQLQITGKPH